MIKKIAVIIPKYGLTGGAEQFAAELTNQLAAQQEFDFHVIANRWQTAHATNFHKTAIFSFPKFLTTPSFAYFAQRHVRREKFSLVHSHERIFSADLFTMHGIPHRYWVRNIRQKSMSLFDWATDWVERKMVYEGNVQKFIAVSTLTRDIFLQEYQVDPDKVTVIHPGVDLKDYHQLDKDVVRHRIRKNLQIGPDEPVVIFVSMNFEIKGLDEVMLSLAKLKAQNKKFKFIVVGKGNIKKYQAIARDSQLMSNILFTGPLTKEKLIEIYLAGDVYIMLSKFDTFGMVVLEAMAAGLPVIISHNVGAKDIVRENENGFIIQDGSNIEYIASKISFLLDRHVRKRFSEAAYKTAQLNTWNEVASKYRLIYQSILEGRIN